MPRPVSSQLKGRKNPTVAYTFAFLLTLVFLPSVTFAQIETSPDDGRSQESQASDGTSPSQGPTQGAQQVVDCRKRAQDAARLQEFAAPASARRKIIVEILLIDFVHMERAIGGAIVESAVLNILAENSHTLLVAPTKEICTGVM